eukprot:4772270-Lingulodinium_polyedra.AAC.1
MRAKSRNVKKFSSGHKRDVTPFSELITFDHMGIKGAWEDAGIGNVVATLDIYDHATKYKAALPVSSYGAEE